MTKVYDCFMFNGEWDMLELRLNTHDPVVDYYVIAESIYTHTGDFKKLQLDLLDSRLQKFLSKILSLLPIIMQHY